jgi:hypothetical protein
VVGVHLHPRQNDEFFDDVVVPNGVQLHPRHISAPRPDRNEIPERLSPHFRVRLFNGAITDTVGCNRKLKIQDGGR